MFEYGSQVCMVRAPDGSYWLAPSAEFDTPEVVDTRPALVAYPGGAMVQTHNLDADDRVTLLVQTTTTAEVKRLERLVEDRDFWPVHSQATVVADGPLFVVDPETGPLIQVTEAAGTYDIHLLARTRPADDDWQQHPQDPLEDHLLFIWPQGAKRRFDEQ